ncbi:MAG: hypothetical protein MHPSP_000204 [Paramarteilia canceri]
MTNLDDDSSSKSTFKPKKKLQKYPIPRCQSGQNNPDEHKGSKNGIIGNGRTGIDSKENSARWEKSSIGQEDKTNLRLSRLGSVLVSGNRASKNLQLARKQLTESGSFERPTQKEGSGTESSIPNNLRNMNHSASSEKIDTRSKIGLSSEVNGKGEKNFGEIVNRKLCKSSDLNSSIESYDGYNTGNCELLTYVMQPFDEEGYIGDFSEQNNIDPIYFNSSQISKSMNQFSNGFQKKFSYPVISNGIPSNKFIYPNINGKQNKTTSDTVSNDNQSPPKNSTCSSASDQSLNLNDGHFMNNQGKNLQSNQGVRIPVQNSIVDGYIESRKNTRMNSRNEKLQRKHSKADGMKPNVNGHNNKHLSEPEKKLLRRANNRIAAAKCRKKKMDTIQILSRSNDQLQVQLSQLAEAYKQIFIQRNSLIESVRSHVPFEKLEQNLKDLIKDYDSDHEVLGLSKLPFGRNSFQSIYGGCENPMNLIESTNRNLLKFDMSLNPSNASENSLRSDFKIINNLYEKADNEGEALIYELFEQQNASSTGYSIGGADPKNNIKLPKEEKVGN